MIRLCYKNEVCLSFFSTYIARAVVADDKINQGDEQVLDVLATAIGQVGAEWIQDDEVLVGSVE